MMQSSREMTITETIRKLLHFSLEVIRVRSIIARSRPLSPAVVSIHSDISQLNLKFPISFMASFSLAVARSEHFHLLMAKKNTKTQLLNAVRNSTVKRKKN